MCRRHYGKAKSPYEFAVAYAEKRRFLIRDMDFTDLLVHGQPDDVDTVEVQKYWHPFFWKVSTSLTAFLL